MKEFENNAELEGRRNEILQRVEDVTLVPYERDRQLVHDVLERIFKIPDWERKRMCLVALDGLVPRYEQGANGREKWIADVKINKGHELLIRSRITAEEIDPTEQLFILPEEVQTHIFSEDMALELTDRCTVACDFCAVAEKGPIKKKMSFDSLIKMFRAYTKYRKATHTRKSSNHFYYNTDPFDWRSLKTENGEVVEDLDMRDIYQAWLKASPKHVQQHLRLSTGIPVGEELRILGFMDMLVQTDNTDHSIRFSLRNEALQRITYIDIILSCINDVDLVKRKVDASTLKNYTAAHNAVKWRQVGGMGDFSHHDIEFMACIDSIPIGPEGGRSAIVGGGSDELPEAEYYQEFVNAEDELTISYQVIHANKPAFDYRRKSAAVVMRTPTTTWNFPHWTVYTYQKDEVGNPTTLVSQEDFYDETDAHRSLLRISDALAVRHLFLRGQSVPLSLDDRAFLGRLPIIDIQNLERYTSEHPGRNKVMEIVLKYIADNAI